MNISGFIFTFFDLKFLLGNEVHSDYKIPYGDWFHYVSCPHYLAEIIIYIAFNIVLNFRNTMMISVLLLTLCNQILTALLSHQWYLRTFRDYPLTRRAVLPYIL